MRISDWSSDVCSSDLYYKVPDAAGLCAERIITATIDARLLALDAITGRPCPGFGHNGAVDLRVDMGRVDPGYYFVTSAPQIVRGRIILGGWVTDGTFVGEPSGDRKSGGLGKSVSVGVDIGGRG